jgi:hypothetical protein
MFVAITTLSSNLWAKSDDAASTSTADDAAATGADASSATEASGVVPAESVAKPVPVTQEKTTSHKGQFSVRLAAVAAYRIVMRYDESPQCAPQQPGKDPQKFCGFGAPAGLDTAIGYAPIAGIEPFIFGRFGLGVESKTHTAPLLAFGAGVRLYSMSDSAFKFFIEPAIGAELEGRASNALDATGPSSAYKQDWLIRLAVGPQYDFSRYVGIYASVAMSVGMVRALHSFMELHGGVQARFP